MDQRSVPDGPLTACFFSKFYQLNEILKKTSLKFGPLSPDRNLQILRPVSESRVKDRSKETLQKREDEEREAKEKKTEDVQSEKKGLFLYR